MQVRKQLDQARRHPEEKVEQRTSELEKANRALIREIAERKRTEQALADERNLLRTLIDNLPDSIYIKDRDSRFVICNQEVVRRKGVDTMQGIIGKTDFDFYPRQLAAEVFADEQNLMRTGQPIVNRERCILDKTGGKKLWNLTSKVPLRDAQGKITGLVGIGRDITERKSAEEALRDSEQRLKAILSSLHETMLIILNRQGRCMKAWGSKEMDARYGVASDQIVGRSFSEFISAEEVEKWRGRFQRIFDTGEPLRDECLVSLPHGSFWLDVSVSAIRDSSGAVTSLLAFVRDISERKQIDQALRDSEQKYRTLVMTLPDAVTVTDLQGRIVEVSPQTLRLHGFDRAEEMLGRSALEVIAPEDRDRAMLSLRKTLECGYVRNVEYCLMKKDGTSFTGELSATLMRNDAGEAMAFIGTVRDVSERKRAEREAQQHLAELTRAWHVNTVGEMASGLAHELNQPLCAVLNYSNGCLRMLRRGISDTDRLEETVEQIAAEAERAGEIIKRIRSLAANREPRKSAMDVNGLVSEATGLMKAEAAKAGVKICAKPAKDLPKVSADEVGMLQVILNLLKNAVESVGGSCSERREVKVTTRLNGGETVEVAVTDTGMGLSDEVRGRIFDSFFTTKKDGLGIGLSLSKRIVEAHGGRLWAESNSSCGATFKFTLPVQGVENARREANGICCR